MQDKSGIYFVSESKEALKEWWDFLKRTQGVSLKGTAVGQTQDNMITKIKTNSDRF